MRVVRRHPVATRQGRAWPAGRQPRDLFRVPDRIRAAARAADDGTAGAGGGTGIRRGLEEVKGHEDCCIREIFLSDGGVRCMYL